MLAAEKAISSPLLETSMEGARSILLSITGGADLSLVEVSEAAKLVGEAAHPDANIIFGANVDEELERPGLGHRRRHPLRRPHAAAAPRRRADDPPHQGHRPRPPAAVEKPGELGSSTSRVPPRLVRRCGP